MNRPPLPPRCNPAPALLRDALRLLGSGILPPPPPGGAAPIFPDMTEPYALPACIAAALCALWFVIHAVVGGKEAEIPLRRDRSLPEPVRAPMVMVWHMMTAVLAAMATMFLGGVLTGNAGVIWAASGLSGAVALAGIAAAPLQGVSFKLLPQGWQFVPPAALGVWSALG